MKRSIEIQLDAGSILEYDSDRDIYVDSLTTEGTSLEQCLEEAWFFTSLRDGEEGPQGSIHDLNSKSCDAAERLIREAYIERYGEDETPERSFEPEEYDKGGY